MNRAPRYPRPTLGEALAAFALLAVLVLLWWVMALMCSAQVVAS